MNVIKEFIYKLRGECSTKKLIFRGMVVGKNFKRSNGVILDPDHCWLLTIGDNVTLAPRVHIICHDASTKHELGYTRIGLVNIGNNVFIGAESVILPGITIGDNVVVGANSVVTNNIPSNSVVAGNPAKVISKLDNYIIRKKKELECCPNYDEKYTMRNSNLTKEMKQKMISELYKNDGIGYVE